MARDVGLRLEAEHAVREVFDIGVIAVVEAAQFAHAVVKISAAFAMLAKPGLRDQQRREIRIAALHIDGKAE